MNNEKQNDRVSYSFGMKLSTGNYQSSDFHVSMTSDVNTGETSEQAFERVRKEVLQYAQLSHDAIRASETGLIKTEEKIATNVYKSVDKPQNTKESKREPPKVHTTNGNESEKSKTEAIGIATKAAIETIYSKLKAEGKTDAKTFKAKYLAGIPLSTMAPQIQEEVLSKLKTDYPGL